MNFEKLSESEEAIGRTIVRAAYQVHKEFGPGLLEKVYETCMVYELKEAGLSVEQQVTFPITYKGIRFEEGLRLDLLVEKKVIVEIKSVEEMNPVWKAQVLSQLRLAGLRLGYLINFNEVTAKSGMKRIIL